MTGDIPPGLAKMNEVYGWQAADGTGDFWELTRDHLFGTVWARPQLDTAQRRLMIIGALAARGRFDVLEIQLDAAYRLGELDADQLREIAIFLAHYDGWPTGGSVMGLVEKVIAKHTKASGT